MLECALVLRMMYPRGVCSRYNLTTLVDRRHIACVRDWRRSLGFVRLRMCTLNTFYSVVDLWIAVVELPR